MLIFLCLLFLAVILSVIFGVFIERNEATAGPIIVLLIILCTFGVIPYVATKFDNKFSNAQVVKMQSVCQKFGGLVEFDKEEFKCHDGTIIKVDSIKLDPEAP